MLTGTTTRCAVLLAGALLLAAGGGARADTFVVGDSLGRGIAAVAGLPYRTRLSVRVGQTAAIEQINALPRGAVAFMSLGTNDAVGPVGRLGPAIDGVLRAARERGLRLVWIGPPCTTSRRVPNVVELDAMLRERVRGDGVAYVSMVEGAHCDPALRTRDGIHFTWRGYQTIWAIARAAADPPGAPQDGDLTAVKAPPPGAAPPAPEQVAAEPARDRAPGRVAAAEPPAAMRRASRRAVGEPAAARPAVAGPRSSAVRRTPPERGRASRRPRGPSPVVTTAPAPRPVPPRPAPPAPFFWPFSRS